VIVNLPVVIYLCSRIPFPISGGREHMIVQSLRFLKKNYDVKVICFKSIHQEENKSGFNELGIEDVEYFNMASPHLLVWNIITRYKSSIQENLYFSSSNLARIEAYIESKKPKVVICDMLRTAQFSINIPQPIIIDFDDMLSDRYRKMLSGDSSYSSLGSFASKIPSWLSWLEKYLRIFLLKFELKRISKSEKKFYECADAVIFTSHLEANKANEKFKSDKAVGIPQAIDRQNLSMKSEKCDNILFLGNMTTAQNLASLTFIIDKVLPHICFDGDGELLIVGKFDNRAEKIIERSNKARLLGFVNSIENIASECKVALMPVAFGTGIKTKILDAISLGLPVISNSVGLEGLDCTHNEHVLKSDDSTMLASFVNQLFTDENLRYRLSNSASLYLSNNHSYDLLSLKYTSLVNSLIK
jgi:polysaccharide biosynthesis protein PslH